MDVSGPVARFLTSVSPRVLTRLRLGLRAFEWLHEHAGFPAQGDDTWIPHVVNRAYGTRFPAPIPSQPGKAMGFADWTHAAPR